MLIINLDKTSVGDTEPLTDQKHDDIITAVGPLSIHMSDEKNSMGNIFPSVEVRQQVFCFDIWHHIAQQIDPEDVGRFALICRQTAYVASTPGFWKNLYRKFASPNQQKHLPIRLQHANVMNEPDGLRSKVIRSLFITYQPFKDQIVKLRHLEAQISDPGDKTAKFYEHPVYQKLQRLEFTGNLIKKVDPLLEGTKKGQWSSFYKNIFPKSYFYKFEKYRPSDNKENDDVSATTEPGHWRYSEEIFNNVNENCVFLSIKTLAMGRIQCLRKPLQGEDLKLGVKHQSLLESLSFCPSSTSQSGCKIPTGQFWLVSREKMHRSSVVYTKTTRFGLYNWWDPLYDQVLYDEF